MWHKCDASDRSALASSRTRVWLESDFAPWEEYVYLSFSMTVIHLLEISSLFLWAGLKYDAQN